MLFNSNKSKSEKNILNQFITLSVIIFVFIQISGCAEKKENSIPERTILFIIDGMATGTLENIAVPNLIELKNSGVFYPEVHLILPAHLDRNMDKDSQNYYPWGCSLPNVPLMTGTVFIGLDSLKQHMIQHSFQNSKTAFIVNDGAYEELRYGFDIYNRFGSTLEDQLDYTGVIEESKKIIENNDPQFMRIHFQGTGSAGYFDRNAGTNIWAADSKYRYEMRRADSVFGDFVNWLKATERWNETTFIVMGDHGQNDEGWHAPYIGQANKQPIIFAGCNIKKEKTFEYAESIDIAPTIAFLNNVLTPEFSIGRALREIKVGEPDNVDPERKIEKLNNLLLKHHNLLIQNTSARTPEFEKINQSFFTLETIGIWHRHFNNIDQLIEHEQRILTRLEEINLNE